MIRAIDVFDAARIAMARGMRGFVFKTHQDTSSASGAYMVRRHVSPTFEVFGRMASNYSTGGINAATLEHYTQIKGGWGRIYEMPTRDSITATTAPGSMSPAKLRRARPWMLMMPRRHAALHRRVQERRAPAGGEAPDRRTGQDQDGRSAARMVLATGHATPEEHLLLVREGAPARDCNVLLTHPGDIPQLPEAARLGAFIEITASKIYKTPAQSAARRRARQEDRRRAHDRLHRLRPDHQRLSDRLPGAGGAGLARQRRHAGARLDLMYKVNPAKLLGLPPPDETMLGQK